MIRPVINPETLRFDGLGHEGLTAEQFASIVPPGCPVCGTPVDIDRIDITWNAEDERLHGRTFIAGRWQCPRGCNPVTGERAHWNQAWGADKGGGTWFECSCTGERHYYLGAAELQALAAEHRQSS